KTTIQRARADALPKAALAKACDYALTLWSRLTRFLEYPELELSNNQAENAMRPIALGSSGSRLPRFGAPGLGRLPHQSSCRTDSQTLGKPQPVAKIRPHPAKLNAGTARSSPGSP